MLVSQDWCLECGAGAPDSLAGGGSSWRSAALVLGAVALLVAGAATAAYAALTKSSPKPRPATTTLAQAPPPVASTTPPATTTPPSALPPTSSKIAAPTTVKPFVPLSKPPKIPLVTATPKATVPTVSTATTTPTASTPSTTPTTPTGGSSEKAEQPEAILLDTNAASTYNPSNYPASDFGDPSLAIDGDTSTAWTALVDPTIAPKMAAGLVIDLKSAQKVSSLILDTATTGMTVQVYGSKSATLPATIADPAWVALTSPIVEQKKHARISLRDSTKPFRFVLLWISKVPASAVGTAQAPGHVGVSELELFPTK